MEVDYLQCLTSVGLTTLEAQAYAHLLEHAPQTAYAVARGIGKPTANTYKAIESLYRKGALILDENEPRTWRPVAPEELLGALERRFREQKETAAQALAGLGAAAVDDRVYRLQTPDQVLERFRLMLRGAEQMAVVDLFPGGVDWLREDLRAAAERGVLVAAKVYSPAAIEGVEVVLDPRGERARNRWSGEWINGVVDGREHLLAWLTAHAKRVHQAVWSGSAFLSWVYHCGLVSEMQCATHPRTQPAEGDAGGSLFERLLSESVAGYRALIRP